MASLLICFYLSLAKVQCFPRMHVNVCLYVTSVVFFTWINWVSIIWQAVCCLWSTELSYKYTQDEERIVFYISVKSFFKFPFFCCFCISFDCSRASRVESLPNVNSSSSFCSFRFKHGFWGFFFPPLKKASQTLKWKQMKREGKDSEIIDRLLKTNAMIILGWSICRFTAQQI